MTDWKTPFDRLPDVDERHDYRWHEDPKPPQSSVARGMVIAMPAALFLWAGIALVYHWIAA